MACIKIFFALIAIAAAASGAPFATDGRIIGGEDTTIERFPHMLSLLYFGAHRCGASILTTHWVLTAAHCLQQYGFDLPVEYITIRAGSSIRNDGGQVYQAAEFFAHELFTEETYDYDIGLVRLASPIIFNTTSIPIRLPAHNQYIADGTMLTVTGWGFTKVGGPHADKLQMVKVPVIETSRCQPHFDNYPYNNTVTDRMVCAGYAEGGRDACSADSGGPMISAEGQVLGIVSWSFSCALPEFPGVYARVSYFIPWIKSIMGDDFPQIY